MLDFIKKVLKPKEGTSPAGKVSGDDVVDVVKVSLLVAVASGLQYAVEHMGNLDFGAYQPFVILGITAVLDFVNKLVKNKKAE